MFDSILPTKTTAAQNEAALSYPRVRGLCNLAVVFMFDSIFYRMYKMFDGADYFKMLTKGISNYHVKSTDSVNNNIYMLTAGRRSI